jgi:hypothetical protein
MRFYPDKLGASTASPVSRRDSVSSVGGKGVGLAPKPAFTDQALATRHDGGQNRRDSFRTERSDLWPRELGPFAERGRRGAPFREYTVTSPAFR